MKSVLRSIKPYWLYLILIGKKRLELGKTKPKADDWDKIVYLYCSRDIKSLNRIPMADRGWFVRQYLGKVACCFVCDYTEEYRAEFCDLEYKNCMSKKCAKNDIHRIIGYNDEEKPIYVFETSNEQDNPDDCELIKNSQVSFDEIRQYIGDTFYDKSFYTWHISDLKIYDKPRGLEEFKTFCKSYYEGDKCDDCKYFIDGRGYEYDESDCGCNGLKPITRPPQSWCYVQAPS